MARVGDLLKTDCGGYFSGYYSDIGRTAVLGRATPEQQSVYSRLIEVHQETIESMRPGVPASHVFDVAAAGYERVNIPFKGLAFAGHGVGLYIHEAPMLSGDERTLLAAQHGVQRGDPRALARPRGLPHRGRGGDT